jgi:TPP-dependent pyruvate/acetoin dehydrogenase alpha subunit
VNAFSSHAATASREPHISIDRETRLKLYRSMLECRLMEKRAHDLFMQNLIKGTSHLALGQEAVAAGFGMAMNADDYTFCTYRGHNHTLVRGVSMAKILGELMGTTAGLMRGKGGSMHLTSVEHGVMGSYAIIGAHMTIATGAAWSAQYRGTKQVAVCFFGDGTTNIGAFHEALNFAVIWKLPVVFVCENNLYMEYTSIFDVTAVEHPAADRASAYGLEPVLIDGNDVDVVYSTAMRALDLARRGGGPSLIEAETYRHGGHSRADPGKYRPDEEVKEWLGKDPLPRYRKRLVDLGINESALEDIEGECKTLVDQATEEARTAPPPDDSLAEKDVWADGGAAWRN